MKIDNNVTFEEDKNLVAIEDWKYWIDNKREGKRIYLIPDILLNYRVHQNSISNRSTDKRYRKAQYLLAKILLDRNISLRHFCAASLFNLIKMKLNS